MRNSRSEASRHLWRERGRLVLLAAVAALPCAGPAAAFTRGRAVEPPPARYTYGPTLYGHTTERDFKDTDKVQEVCDFYLGRPARGYYEACYIPALDLVVMPAKGVWPSDKEWSELRQHEWAHARGWRHPAG